MKGFKASSSSLSISQESIVELPRIEDYKLILIQHNSSSTQSSIKGSDCRRRSIISSQNVDVKNAGRKRLRTAMCRSTHAELNDKQLACIQ